MLSAVDGKCAKTDAGSTHCRNVAPDRELVRSGCASLSQDTPGLLQE